MIEPKDEQLHDYGPHPDWQESFYFNWADPERRAFTLARIGYRFNAGKTDGLIISLRDGETELFYGPADIDHEGPCSDEDPARGLRARRFVVTMEEPLRRWRLELEGDQSMDLVFEAHTPVFDYHEGGRRLASTMTGQHFEQTGRDSSEPTSASTSCRPSRTESPWTTGSCSATGSTTPSSGSPSTTAGAATRT